MGTVSADDFESGTTAAACGGTTTIIDFVIPSKGRSVLEALETWHGKVRGKAVVDYGFHMALVEFNDQVAAEIPGRSRGSPASRFLAKAPSWWTPPVPRVLAAKENGGLLHPR